MQPFLCLAYKQKLPNMQILGKINKLQKTKIMISFYIKIKGIILLSVLKLRTSDTIEIIITTDSRT